jgi:hypothetical protein
MKQFAGPAPKSKLERQFVAGSFWHPAAVRQQAARLTPYIRNKK